MPTPPDEFHPIQVHEFQLRMGRDAHVPAAVALRAYEVYCKLFGPQPAMIDVDGRGCRGGFGAGELIAMLYARSFPEGEWRIRFEEALKRRPR